MIDYDKRLDELEAKLEREGLTMAEDAELRLIRTKLIREAKEHLNKQQELLAQLLADVEKF